ncbi:MAG TPA: hypothetical protein VH969_17120 [Actinophytocola sp.]|uniref:hypothetical protein n=1 Tax=Actinophytocola sp. TaxID=1872138 RepID=UPI002F948866
MPRTMYDSVTPSAIPRGARMVAGYLPPSRYAWSKAEWAMFPNAVKVRIAIFASVNDGHVLDVEPGDATPAQAPGWVVMRRRAGVDPSVYCNASTWPTVRAEFRRRGIREPHYWIAKYDNVARLPAGAVAKQYANPPLHGRGHFDLSIVANHWPGVDKEDDMQPSDPASDPGGGRWGHVWLNTNMLVNNRSFGLAALGRKIDALAAVAAAGREMAPDELNALIDESVAKHTPTEADVVAEHRAILEEIVRDVAPDQADAIIAKLDDRLGN